MTVRRLTLFLIAVFIGFAGTATAQSVGIKTNGLYWLTTTTNAALEFSTGRKTTFEIAGAYNPWTFKNDKKLRFLALQPEAKYWFCEKFEGHFVGLHLHGAQFYSTLGNKRRDGWLAGAGLSYGYDWILSPHFNLEAEIGVGYARLWYKKSDCIPCRKDVKNETKDYVGPTRAALSLVYLF